MPFTVTHLAAIIPIKHSPLKFLPLSALAIGCMVPDMPMFFSFTGRHSVTHSIPGLFTHCVPIGIAVYVLFQWLVKDALLAILPPGISEQLSQKKKHTLYYMMLVVAALLLGAATHVFWDSFTNRWGWGVSKIPALRNNAELFGYTVSGHRLVQHFSSVLLLPVLIYIVLKSALRGGRATVANNVFARHPWLIMTIIFAAPALIALIQGRMQSAGFIAGGLELAARLFGTYMVSATVIYAVLYQLTQWHLKSTRALGER